MRCGDLEGAWLKLRAYDYAVVRIAGVRVGSVWRAVPPHIHLRRHLCTDSERIVDLTITVAAYGRDNFFPTGTPSALNKGIVGAVELTYASGRRAPLQGWQVAVMPLVQPGRVLHWGDERAELPTHKLVRASKRMPYDSMFAGVWAHGSRCKGRAEQAWWHAEPEDGPTFYRYDAVCRLMHAVCLRPCRCLAVQCQRYCSNVSSAVPGEGAQPSGLCAGAPSHLKTS